MRSFSQRFAGALRLDVATYEEVEADPRALPQAMVVVVISAVASGIGLLYYGSVGDLVRSAVGALLLWFVWAGLTWFIGTRILPAPETSSSWGELLRTLGFSSAPGVFNVLTLVPIFGSLVAFLVDIWMLVAMVVAVRQALDYRSTWRAVAVCMTGFVVYVMAKWIFVPELG